MSFRKTLRLTIIPLTLIPILILGILTFFLVSENTDKQSREALEGLAETLGISLENYVGAQNREMLLMSKLKQLKDCVYAGDQEDVKNLAQEALKDWVEADPDYVAAYILNEQGIITICYEGQHVGKDLSGLSVFKETLGNDVITSKDKINLVLDFERESIYRSCILEVDGYIGVLVLETSLKFYDKLVENISYGETGASYIVDDQGVIICHSESAKRQEVLSYDVGSSSLVNDFKSGIIPQNGCGNYMYQDIERLMGYYVIDDLGWAFVMRQSVSEVNQSLVHIISVMTTVFVIVLVLSIVFCIILIRSFTNPLQRLQAVFYKAATKGEYILCDVIGCNEFTELAKGYNSMIVQLNTMDEELRQNYILLAAEQEKTNHLAKQLSISLEQQTTTLSTMYSSIPDLIFCKDIKGLYTSCNPSFERFAGRREEEIIGKSDIEIFGTDKTMAEQFAEADNKILESKETDVTEEQITYNDGTKRLVETIKAPLIQNGTVVGLIGISRDITSHKEAEEEALVASKAKSAFLAHMSHEIRTPLNAIIGMSGIVKNSLSDKEKALTSINQVISSSNHLLNILNDVLDMSKIESGKLELTYKPFNHLESCREVISIISPQCVEKDIKFITNYDSIENLTNIMLMGDKLRLKQVLINLMGNAVKFSKTSGNVEFTVNIMEEDDSSIRIMYAISDNGIGMTNKQVSKLFTPFEQGDSSIASKFGGTGLGLSISQSIVNEMGGNIKVLSQQGDGTKFYFDIVYEKSHVVIEESSEAQDLLYLNGKRILLVEDVEINRVIINELLSPTGVEIHIAENGQQGLDLVEKSSQGFFDLIFMDVQMPILNGYEATKKIRMLEREDAGQIPIIAMTANAYSEDVANSLAAGMNAHLTKPIDIVAIMEVLRKYLS